MAATLELYLVRHAIAAERGPDHPDDRKRPLTPQGLARSKQQVRGLKLLGVEIDVVGTDSGDKVEMAELGAPSARSGHVGIWTGRQLMIWGGLGESGSVGDGALYDP